MSRGPIKAEALSVLRARGVPVSTVIDVGVLHGTKELILAYPDCEHILFEPVEEFAEEIGRAYAGISHRLIRAAVSDRSGTIGLATTSIIPGLAVSHSWMAEGGSRTVPMISLDDYLKVNQCGAPFFVKIDVDGSEMQVLKGAEETLKRTSVVMIEAPVDSFAERVFFLQTAGFRIFDIVEPCYYDGGFWQADALMVKSAIYAGHFADIRTDFNPSKYDIFTG
jgi:FkbM family methyltransferase